MVPVACQRIVNVQPGANKAEAGLNPARRADFFASDGRAARLEFAATGQPFCCIGVTQSRLVGAIAAEFKEIQMKRIKTRTATLPAGLPARFYLAAAALILALLAIPHPGNAFGQFFSR